MADRILIATHRYGVASQLLECLEAVEVLGLGAEVVRSCDPDQAELEDREAAALRGERVLREDDWVVQVFAPSIPAVYDH